MTRLSKGIGRLTIASVIAAGFILFCSTVRAAMPVTTDSRIRTFVYGENEVFQLSTKYGYQSNIEFSNNEEVYLISLGDTAAWQVTPAGRRLFVNALEENAHTNMTVITNKRVYQFELFSSDKMEDAELIYVIRFYYPENDFDKPSQLSGTDDIAIKAGDREAGYNFNYTLTGPNDIAPLKVFDDGKYTYFAFPNGNKVIPLINSVDADGRTDELMYRIVGDYVVVEKVARQFSLLHGRSVVNVFNDSKSQPES